MAEYKRLSHTKAQRHEDEEKGFSRKSIIGASNLIEVVQIGVLLCAAVAMISLGLYCVVNSSGHSADDLRWMSVPFLAVTLIGVLTMRRPGAWRLSLILLLAGSVFAQPAQVEIVAPYDGVDSSYKRGAVGETIAEFLVFPLGVLGGLGARSSTVL